MSSAVDSDKRQALVAKAYDLFRRGGFHATGVEAIIAEADVARMTMYRHFPGKDELIVAVLRWRAERFERQIDRLLQKPGSAARQIAAIVDWHARWFRRADFRGCLFAHALAEFGDPAHPVFREAASQKRRFRERLADILAEELPRRRAQRTAASLAMLFDGATLAAETGDPASAARALRDAADAATASGR